MKLNNISFIPLVFFCCLFLIQCKPPSAEEPETAEIHNAHSKEYYDLTTYHFKNLAQVAVTDVYLEKALLPGLHRQGIDRIGVFKSRVSQEDTLPKTYVLIPFPSMEAFQNHKTLLDEDTAYKNAGKEFIEAAFDQPPYERVETNLMAAFDGMPILKPTVVEGTRADRIYELRSYESPTDQLYKNKVEMFNTGGELDLFTQLNFNAVFYGDVLVGSRMPNLIYMTTFPNQVVRDSLWEVFVASPEWNGMKDLPQYLNTVSKADIMLLYPTEYSDY